MKQKQPPTDSRQATDDGGDTDDRPQGWTREQGQPRKGTTRPTETARRGGHPDRLFFSCDETGTADDDTDGHGTPRPRRQATPTTGGGDTGDRPQGWTDSPPDSRRARNCRPLSCFAPYFTGDFTPLTSL